MRALFFLLLFTAFSAHASNWVVIAKNAKSDEVFDVWEMDQSSVLFRDGLRQAWIRYSISPPRPIHSGSSEFHHSSVSLGIFDCTYKESADVQYTMYSERFSAGNVVATKSRKRDEAKQDLTAVAPGTYNEIILKAVCSARLNKP